jgi:hypothetical protein
VGLGGRGRRGLEGAPEGAGGSRRERVPSALPSGDGSQRWRGTGVAAPSAGGDGARGRMGGRGGADRRENDHERIKIFPLCVLISRECVFTAIGLATNHWSL